MATHPCPCGYDGDPSGRCRCTPDIIARYRARVSGPLLDRIDMHVHVPNLARELLLRADSLPSETSGTVRGRVVAAQARQRERAGKCNARLTAPEVTRYCTLGAHQNRLLATAVERLGLSGRGLHRILKLARTIADLEPCVTIADHHLTEALAYRRPERRPPA